MHCTIANMLQHTPPPPKGPFPVVGKGGVGCRAPSLPPPPPPPRPPHPREGWPLPLVARPRWLPRLLEEEGGAQGSGWACAARAGRAAAGQQCKKPSGRGSIPATGQWVPRGAMAPHAGGPHQRCRWPLASMHDTAAYRLARRHAKRTQRGAAGVAAELAAGRQRPERVVALQALGAQRALLALLRDGHRLQGVRGARRRWRRCCWQRARAAVRLAVSAVAVQPPTPASTPKRVCCGSVTNTRQLGERRGARERGGEPGRAPRRAGVQEDHSAQQKTRLTSARRRSLASPACTGL